MKIKVRARVRSQGGSCSICGANLLSVFRFLVVILIPPVAPHSLIILPSALSCVGAVSAVYVNSLMKSTLAVFYLKCGDSTLGTKIFSRFVRFRQTLFVYLPFLSEY
jgi:hypothetical protein